MSMNGKNSLSSILHCADDGWAAVTDFCIKQMVGSESLNSLQTTLKLNSLVLSLFKILFIVEFWAGVACKEDIWFFVRFDPGNTFCFGRWAPHLFQWAFLNRVSCFRELRRRCDLVRQSDRSYDFRWFFLDQHWGWMKQSCIFFSFSLDWLYGHRWV